jgi:hypothetical protein
MCPSSIHAGKALLIGAAFAAIAAAQNQPLLPENSVTHVSDHVYAIQGWTNVGIIVGDRATLVVDTGMGPRNGATVVRDVQKLAKNPKLYLTRLAILDQLEPMKPRLIVPDHGALGDGSLIAKERAFLFDLQKRALELKRQGTTLEEAGKLLTNGLKTKYPDWQNTGPVPNVVRRVYAESQ